MQKIRDFLTLCAHPEVRQGIYNVVVAVFALLLVVGVIAPEQVEQFKEAIFSVGSVVALLTNLLASKNVSSN